MDKYVLDTDALIDLHGHFSNEFNILRRLVKGDLAKISEGVYRELQRKSDKLSKRVDNWRKRHQQFVIYVKQDGRLQLEFARIEQAYGEKIRVGGREYKGFWKSPAGRKAADGHSCYREGTQLYRRFRR